MVPIFSLSYQHSFRTSVCFRPFVWLLTWFFLSLHFLLCFLLPLFLCLLHSWVSFLLVESNPLESSWHRKFCLAAFMFFAVLIFGLSYTRRDWLMYPNWNILSWSYGFAVLASLFHAAAAVHLYYASRKSYDLRRESRNLIMQMHPISQHRLGW